MQYTSAQKRDNLKVLADYLAALPEDYVGFEMADFFNVLGVEEKRTLYFHDKLPYAEYVVVREQAREIANDYAAKNGGVAKCGAVACAIGHGPSAGFLAAPDDFNSVGDIAWVTYTRRVFLDYNGYEAYQRTFSWMFGGAWSRKDNTPHGAARRIRQFLTSGVPADFNQDNLHTYQTEHYA